MTLAAPQVTALPVLPSRQLGDLNDRMALAEWQIEEYFENSEACQKLAEVPGTGLVAALSEQAQAAAG